MAVFGFCVVPFASGRGADRQGATERPRVLTDGRLRPGHFETIRLRGFPGKGKTEVAFFPTAICERGCGAAERPGRDTDARGSAKFQVRMPGTFTAHDGKPVFFRDGERINVEVLWHGPHDAFRPVSAYPEPILVRAKGHRHG